MFLKKDSEIMSRDTKKKRKKEFLFSGILLDNGRSSAINVSVFKFPRSFSIIYCRKSVTVWKIALKGFTSGFNRKNVKTQKAFEVNSRIFRCSCPLTDVPQFSQFLAIIPNRPQLFHDWRLKNQ